MAIRLKSVFQDRRSALLLKAVVFGVFLWIAQAGEGGFAPALFFILVSGVLYFSPSFRGGKYIGSILVLVSLALFLERNTVSTAFSLLGIPFFSALAFFLFGAKELVFARARTWALLFAFGVTYAATLALFLIESDAFIRAAFTYGIMIFLTWRDFFSSTASTRISTDTPLVGNESGEEKIVQLRGSHYFSALVITYLGVETAWAVRLLPLDAIGGANLTFLGLIAVLNIILRSAEQGLSKRILLMSVTVFIALLLFMLWMNL
ncbi:MAG: hypothetical protein AAB407_01730 [Patescibacteria group bacterium]